MSLLATWSTILITSGNTGRSVQHTKPLPRISNFGLLSAVLFLVLSLVGRFLYPFGDEPDFEVRSYDVLHEEHPWWSPYSIFHGLISNWDNNNICNIDASPLSLWGHIPTNCTENLQQILTRFGLTAVLMLPLLLAIIFRKTFVSLVDPQLRRLDAVEWSLRLDALALAILLPGVVGVVGMFAEEQFVVILSLLTILVVVNPLFTMGLLFLVCSLDLGNGIVVFTAAFLLYLNRFLTRKFGFRVLRIAILVQLTMALVAGFTAIDIFSGIPFIAEKVNGITSSYIDDGSFARKYPVILRPIITFMSALFMSPAGLKVIPLYIFFGIFIFIGFRRFKQFRHKKIISKYGQVQHVNNLSLDEHRVLFITAFHVVLLFVFLLPTYSNAKYYLFLLPLILVGALQVFSRDQIRGWFLFSNILAFIFLILFRIK